MVVDQSELGSLPFESTTFGEIVRDDTIGEVFDEAVHPAWDILDLVALRCLVDVGCLQMLDVGLIEHAIIEKVH